MVAGAKLERSRMLLLQGNGPAAHDELARADDPALWAREKIQRLPAHDLDYLTLARARWEIAFGDARAALDTIDAELHAALAAARLRRVLKLRLLRALALQRAGSIAEAIAEAAEVLQTASHEGYMRLILDEGPAAALLVQRFANALQDSATARGSSDPILGEYVQRLLQAAGPVVLPDGGEAESAEAAGTDALVTSEPLTRKEIRVLQLLAEGYSNGAMAEKLFVSDSTVRTHLRNINMKLDAKSRTQAVAIARRLGVIR